MAIILVERMADGYWLQATSKSDMRQAISHTTVGGANERSAIEQFVERALSP